MASYDPIDAWAAFELDRRLKRADTLEEKSQVWKDAARARQDPEFRARLAQIAEHGRLRSGPWPGAERGLFGTSLAGLGAATAGAKLGGVAGSLLGPLGTVAGGAAGAGLGLLGAANLWEGLQRRSEGLPGATGQIGWGAADVAMPFSARLFRALKGALPSRSVPPDWWPSALRKREAAERVGVLPRRQQLGKGPQRATLTGHPFFAPAGVPAKTAPAGERAIRELLEGNLQKNLDYAVPSRLTEGTARGGGTVGSPAPHLPETFTRRRSPLGETSARGWGGFVRKVDLPYNQPHVYGLDAGTPSWRATTGGAIPLTSLDFASRMRTRRPPPKGASLVPGKKKDWLGNLLKETMGGKVPRLTKTGRPILEQGEDVRRIPDSKWEAGLGPRRIPVEQPNIYGLDASTPSWRDTTGRTIPDLTRQMRIRTPQPPTTPTTTPRGTTTAKAAEAAEAAEAPKAAEAAAQPPVTPTAAPQPPVAGLDTIIDDLSTNFISLSPAFQAIRAIMRPGWKEEKLVKEMLFPGSPRPWKDAKSAVAEPWTLFARRRQGSGGGPGKISDETVYPYEVSKDLQELPGNPLQRRPKGERFARKMTISNKRHVLEEWRSRDLTNNEWRSAVKQFYEKPSYKGARERLGLGDKKTVAKPKGVSQEDPAWVRYDNWLMSISGVAMSNRMSATMKILQKQGLLSPKMEIRLTELVHEGYTRAHHQIATTGFQAFKRSGEDPLVGVRKGTPSAYYPRKKVSSEREGTSETSPLGQEMIDFLNGLREITASLALLFAGVFAANQFMPQGDMNAAAG
jgi:hypothetical protein